LFLIALAALRAFLTPNDIEAALGRPMNYMQYETDCDIHLIAAIILDPVARYHAFADGNKRTALLTTLFIYRVNGFQLEYGHVMNEKFEELVLSVADNKVNLSIQELRSQIRALIEKYQQP
jgi:death on curing protein